MFRIQYFLIKVDIIMHKRLYLYFHEYDCKPNSARKGEREVTDADFFFFTCFTFLLHLQLLLLKYEGAHIITDVLFKCCHVYLHKTSQINGYLHFTSTNQCLLGI